MSNIDHRNQIAKILEEISSFEYNNPVRRPLLSALVLRSADGTIGNGFYKLCENLGLDNWEKRKNDGVLEAQEITKCIEFWAKESNYLKYR